MSYGLAVGLALAAAAWLCDAALAALGRPRRTAWLVGIALALLVPVITLSFGETAPAVRFAPGPESAPTQAAVLAQVRLVSELRVAEAGGTSLDRLAALAWILASLTTLGFYLLGARRLARRARRWPVTGVDGHAVEVAPDIGPAVFGLLRPRVIFPRWLIASPAGVRRMALSHELQHLAARDSQWLSAATLLSALFPWNLPLVWMLRRLRFAMEVDCDARVLRTGVDANDYGLAMLYVSEQQIRAPHAAMALIERTSQLERRINIMFASPRRLPTLFAGACLTLAGSCLVAAAQLDAPAMAALQLKPPPAMGENSPGFRLGQKFELLLREQYPELLQQKFQGTPIVVALVNDDWSIARSAKTIAPEPIDSVEPDERMFGIVGVAREDVPYVGAMQMKQSQESEQFILMLYTERKTSGKRFVSSLFPDTRAADRAIFRQVFAGSESIPAGQRPWVLLDRSGNVLRSGIEQIEPETWLGQLQQRYGVRTREVTVTPLTNEKGEPLLDQGGQELQLNTLWLAPDSPGPGN